MLFTIEPMINLGKPHVKILSDGWTAVTRDRSLSAQFEHTVGCHRDGLRGFHRLAAWAGPALTRSIERRLNGLQGCGQAALSRPSREAEATLPRGWLDAIPTTNCSS
jgi:hypothetical protein